jgi:hypothetical protein
MVAGVDDERATLADAPLAAPERVLVQQGGRRVSVDPSARVDPVLGEIHAARQLSRGHSERLLVMARK